MKKILVFALAMCFVLGLAFASGALASQKDAKALVDKAAAYVKANGKDAALKEFSKPKGQFDKGELYVFAYDMSATIVAHPKNQKLIGKNLMDVPDTDGKLFRKEIVETAKRTGAKVRAKATIRGTQTQQLRLIDAGGTPYGNQSFVAHFGLGDAPIYAGGARRLCHGRGAAFPLKGNINVAQGTIKLWVTPIDWKAGDGLFHHFFRIVGQKPAANKTAREFELILYKFGEWDTVVAFGMADELTGSNLIEIPMDAMWKPKKWHQVVFTWDREGAALYVDAKGKTQKYLRGPPDALFAKSFIVGGPYFAENKTLTAIDELAIYARKLSAHEIDEMYRVEIIESAMLR